MVKWLKAEIHMVMWFMAKISMKVTVVKRLLSEVLIKAWLKSKRLMKVTRFYDVPVGFLWDSEILMKVTISRLRFI